MLTKKLVNIHSFIHVACDVVLIRIDQVVLVQPWSYLCNNTVIFFVMISISSEDAVNIFIFILSKSLG